MSVPHYGKGSLAKTVYQGSYLDKIQTQLIDNLFEFNGMIDQQYYKWTCDNILVEIYTNKIVKFFKDDELYSTLSYDELGELFECNIKQTLLELGIK